MHRFWKPIIKDVINRLQPKSIVEIGIGKGWNTEHLLQYCKNKDAVLHAIDPNPKVDMVELTEGNEEHFVWHHCTSLEALPEIVLIKILENLTYDQVARMRIISV